MTLTQLEYVVALDAVRHFAKAAERCHITQPSLSMQVQNLEEELGVQIFLRTNPVTTTETGRIVVDQAIRILSEAEALHQLVQQERNIIAGRLKIGVLPTLAPYLLPHFLQAFISEYPQLRLSVQELTTEHIIRQLRNGSLDAGILATPLNHADLKESFLFNEELIIADPGISICSWCFDEQLTIRLSIKSKNSSMTYKRWHTVKPSPLTIHYFSAIP